MYLQHYELFPFKGRRGGAHSEYGGLYATAVVRAFDMLSAEEEAGRGMPAVSAAGGVVL